MSDIDESRLQVGAPKKQAVGVPPIVHALQVAEAQVGVVRSAQALLPVNQKEGLRLPAGPPRPTRPAPRPTPRPPNGIRSAPPDPPRGRAQS